jgi:hypothetical protein
VSSKIDKNSARNFRKYKKIAVTEVDQAKVTRAKNQVRHSLIDAFNIIIVDDESADAKGAVADKNKVSKKEEAKLKNRLRLIYLLNKMALVFVVICVCLAIILIFVRSYLGVGVML